MRKTLYIISFAAIALAALTSCAKDQFKENVIPAGEKIQVSINGLIGELTPADATKATAGSVVRVKWVNGDKVFVYDGTAASIGTLTVTPDDNNASYALLSGEITASAASPSKLTLVYAKGATEAPAIAGGKISIDLSAQDQTEVPFVLYSTIDYATDALSKAEEYITFEFATSVMTVNCTDLPTNEGSKIDITKAEIDGVSTVCELTVTGSGVTVAGASKGTITRTTGFEQSDSRGAFRLALAADPAAPAARNILVYQGSKVSGAPFASTTLATSMSYNTVYQLGEYVLPTPADALPGVFTVADDGNGNVKKVYFSKGNLVATIDATGAPTAWKFAANQYDYLGEGGANKTIGAAAGGVDLFGWSASNNGGTSTTDNYGIMTSTQENDYSGDFYDWGKAIDDGKTWRTLLTAEWQYLFNTRTMTNGKVRYSNAVKGVTIGSTTYKGVFLYPDNYNGEVVSSSMTWDAINAAGIVFLPAAGYRNGSYVSNVGAHGSYWSSSASDESGAYSVAFISSEVGPVIRDDRYFGSSVRLVTSGASPKPVVPVTSVTLNKIKTEIEAGAKDTLVATVQPANATHKEVTWSSSDETIATVDKTTGEVTGVAAGSAVITATTTSGNFTAVCIVTVIQGLPADALKGVFSVSATKKVRFSKGNLWYGKKEGESGSSLHFEDAQWESTPTSDGPIDNNHMSHFNWSSTVEKAVSTSYDGNYLFCDESHKQSVDGSEAIWYALSIGELQYLFGWNPELDYGKGNFDSTSPRYNLYKGGVTVCEKSNCLVLAPDECLNGYSFDNTKTSYNAEEWATAEAAGLVCLPITGYRPFNSNIEQVGGLWGYWSSSAAGKNDCACDVGFDWNSHVVGFNDEDARLYGFSVRLITDVK